MTAKPLKVETAGMPATIRIGPFTYELEMGGERFLKTQIEIGDSLYGRTEEKSLRISISDTVAVEIQKETLLHEIIHAILMQSGVEIDNKLEESIVRSISPMLFDTLLRNPQLTSYLFGETNGR